VEDHRWRTAGVLIPLKKNQDPVPGIRGIFLAFLPVELRAGIFKPADTGAD
jgi:hypothetical protein